MSSGVAPESFPIGSVESRAAARILLSRRIDTRKRMTIVFNIPRGIKDPSRVFFGEWQECPGGSLTRIAYAPHVWLKPGDPAPACPDCGTVFKKTTEYPNMVGFEADCLNKHDPDLNGQSKSTGLFR